MHEERYNEMEPPARKLTEREYVDLRQQAAKDAEEFMRDYSVGDNAGRTIAPGFKVAESTAGFSARRFFEQKKQVTGKNILVEEYNEYVETFKKQCEKGYPLSVN